MRSTGEDRLASALEGALKPPWVVYRNVAWLEKRPGDGEGNIWPSWTGVITDPSVLRQALGTLDERGFANPYPLKYEPIRKPELEPWFVRTFMPDYQGATVWTSLGSMYLQLMHTVDPLQARLEMDRYVSWIERDRTFWEVIDDETGLYLLDAFGRKHALVVHLFGPPGASGFVTGHHTSGSGG